MIKRKSKAFEFEGEQYEARELSAGGLSSVYDAQKAGTGEAALALIVISDCIYQDGKRLFDSPDDVREQLPGRVMERFADEASTLSGLGDNSDPKRKGPPRPRKRG
jgi:hypothetical protein